MNEQKLKQILTSIAEGTLNVDAGIAQLSDLAFESVGEFAMLDHHRELRTGFPEVIFAPGKTDDQIIAIFLRLLQKNHTVLATRVTPSVYDRLQEKLPMAKYDTVAQILYTRESEPTVPGIVVVTAGTGDIPVAEEAALTAELMGNKVTRVYDVGVSGLHRLLHRLPELQSARVIIVAAGMEGALASVIGGLVACPVIAVPTSIGYGASFHGLAALLAMLNSCANGIGVVNIDNGYGAACLASKINQMKASSQ